MTPLKEIEKQIREVQNFPKEGILFKDIVPVLDKEFRSICSHLEELIDWDGVESCVGIDSRGFILAGALAHKRDLGFIPVRKKGKLPPPVHSESYQLEYGFDSLEILDVYDKKKVVILDDLIATGGTLKAAINLCHKAGLEVTACLSVINLKFLNNLSDLETPVHSLFEY